ncbi:hypothetical protein ACWGBY_05455 [Streptomyces griseus]|uniref:hypothetical protein n=1 Tax=Streptomyces griseus TaxID=1911 RepID=UPI00379A1569
MNSTRSRLIDQRQRGRTLIADQQYFGKVSKGPCSVVRLAFRPECLQGTLHMLLGLVEAVRRMLMTPLSETHQPQEFDGGCQAEPVPGRSLVSHRRRCLRTGLIVEPQLAQCMSQLCVQCSRSPGSRSSGIGNRRPGAEHREQRIMVTRLELERPQGSAHSQHRVPLTELLGCGNGFDEIREFHGQPPQSLAAPHMGPDRTAVQGLRHPPALGERGPRRRH